MPIIRREDAGGIEPVRFGGEPLKASAPQPWRVKQVNLNGETIQPGAGPAQPPPSPSSPSGQPPPRSPSAPPPPPPPPPVVEISPELMEAIYRQAVEQGLQDGQAQVFAELTVLQERYAGALDQLIAASQALATRNQLQLISLSCQIAERLVREHLQLNPLHLMNIIVEVLSAQEERDGLIIHCSPPDHAYLSERRADLAAAIGGALSIQIMADPTLEYGDFRVETRLGSTDGRVSSRVREVEAALRGDPHV
ncbi:hypothetical protein KKF91_03780 [Myxococcota bacterium]|nr:hypothetical protein [Myxococcota bacterium]MBU1429663.1 hypothetical protein [Myxococcota bacterium]MBU1898124.1 hypothetical protein [Myxococcota bacterium]